jgi:hypothetical protein
MKRPGGGAPFVPGLDLHGLTWLYDPVVALTTRERVFRERRPMGR